MFIYTRTRVFVILHESDPYIQLDYSIKKTGFSSDPYNKILMYRTFDSLRSEIEEVSIRPFYSPFIFKEKKIQFESKIIINT